MGVCRERDGGGGKGVGTRKGRLSIGGVFVGFVVRIMKGKGVGEGVEEVWGSRGKMVGGIVGNLEYDMRLGGWWVNYLNGNCRTEWKERIRDWEKFRMVAMYRQERELWEKLATRTSREMGGKGFGSTVVLF